MIRVTDTIVLADRDVKERLIALAGNHVTTEGVLFAPGETKTKVRDAHPSFARRKSH